MRYAVPETDLNVWLLKRHDGTPDSNELLQHWLSESGLSLEGSTFYSDSRNDLPLLEQVSHPVAVDPDDSLRATATERGWPVISLR